MTTTAVDYTWFAERFPELEEAYCLTLVKGLTAFDLLRRLGVREWTGHGGSDRLVELAYGVWEEHHGRELFVAVTEVDATYLCGTVPVPGR